MSSGASFYFIKLHFKLHVLNHVVSYYWNDIHYIIMAKKWKKVNRTLDLSASHYLNTSLSRILTLSFYLKQDFASFTLQDSRIKNHGILWGIWNLIPEVMKFTWRTGVLKNQIYFQNKSQNIFFSNILSSHTKKKVTGP